MFSLFDGMHLSYESIFKDALNLKGPKCIYHFDKLMSELSRYMKSVNVINTNC